ncbi:hypothetical protein CEXT_578611 [Caerostris extrusa]|uniref:Ribosomal protein S4 n=1 Tax=Caerostris extrusa TaxID=172846 RepID=A0AAV4SAE5_CAEEX|nr:hypothetical protein CEXT_578611 [Caerostris extrusa]
MTPPLAHNLKHKIPGPPSFGEKTSGEIFNRFSLCSIGKSSLERRGGRRGSFAGVLCKLGRLEALEEDYLRAKYLGIIEIQRKRTSTFLLIFSPMLMLLCRFFWRKFIIGSV